MIKIPYSKFSTFEFQSACNKIASTPTDGNSAYKIRKILKELKDARAKIAEEYRKELMDVYAVRDAEGKYTEETFAPIAEKAEEFQKAQEKFGEKEVTVLRPLLTLHDIRDMKLSANEQEALSLILDDSSAEKPDAPAMMRVK